MNKKSCPLIVNKLLTTFPLVFQYQQSYPQLLILYYFKSVYEFASSKFGFAFKDASANCLFKNL